MQKRLLYTVLYFCLTAFVLTGCAEADKEPVMTETVQETVSEPVKPVVEDTKEEEPAPESIAENTDSESADDSAEDVADAEESIEDEEPEPEIDDKDTEFDANLNEYLSYIDSLTYDFESHGKYKVCYFADDINEDGFPEVFQYRYRDITADFREAEFRSYNVSIVWNEKQSRYVYCANGHMFMVANYILMSASFGSPEIDLSYTKGEENILYSGAVTSDRDGTEVTFKELQVFRDAEMLFGGSAKMTRVPAANDQWGVNYLIFDASYRTYGDEEHFNNFDSDSTYETIIRFGTDELWSTWQEAVEHLGEMP